MLNIGAAELLVIGVVALIVVGPEQLPTLIRRVGKVVGQVRNMTDGLKKDFMETVDETKDFKNAVDPTSWTTGSGTDDDPVVPRGLAEATDADDAPEDEADDQAAGDTAETAETDDAAGDTAELADSDSDSEEEA